MSITASWLILAIVGLRVLRKKAPKAILCVLWALVGIRLVCPFSVESVLSLIPSSETVSPDIVYSHAPVISSGVPAINHAINPIISSSFTPGPSESANPLQIWISAASIVWIAGVAALLLYGVISYLRLRRRVNAAMPLRDTVWLCDEIKTPFILGIVNPRIYLPSDIDEQKIGYVVAHENAHLKRRDHWWKLLSFALLSVYWFNPLMWLAYILLCRDIELACDERVVKEMSIDYKKAYSNALLSCSVPRRMILACPLAFGEVGVKERIKTVLNYRKPAFWIIAAAVAACVVVALCFLTNPKEEKSPYDWTHSVSVEDVTMCSVTTWEMGAILPPARNSSALSSMP
jgi:beta-lactamase regulating signal transducer with metallopeptidase domain